MIQARPNGPIASVEAERRVVAADEADVTQLRLAQVFQLLKIACVIVVGHAYDLGTQDRASGHGAFGKAPSSGERQGIAVPAFSTPRAPAM